MNATELATVVEGWATLVGLMVVVAGATFAGVQLRQDVRSRRLQAIMAVLSNVRTPEVGLAWERVRALPDGFDLTGLPDPDRDSVQLVAGSFNRLGNLLAAGLVREEDIFPFMTFSRGAVDAWEKTKHVGRTGLYAGSGLPSTLFFEYLAGRAQDYLEREGVQRFGAIPVFDADPAIMARVAREVSEARSAA